MDVGEEWDCFFFFFGGGAGGMMRFCFGWRWEVVIGGAYMSYRYMYIYNTQHVYEHKTIVVMSPISVVDLVTFLYRNQEYNPQVLVLQPGTVATKKQ